MRPRTRWILILLGLAALVLVGLRLAAPDDGLPVETAHVEPDTLRVTVAADGQTRLVDRYTVDAPISGRIARITLREGDPILAGRLITRVDPVLDAPRDRDVARTRVAAAEAQRAGADAQRQAAEAQRLAAVAAVAEAEARTVQAHRDADRADALARDSVFSRQEAEQVALAARSAEQQLAAARAALRAAEADVAARTAGAAASRAAVAGAARQATGGGVVPVVAPATGRVLRLYEPSARVVTAGTPLLEIGDAERIEVVVDVLSEDAVQIAPGADVWLDGWGGEGTLRGEVRRVEPAAFTEVSALGVEEQRVNVIVDLIDTPAGFGAGYRVEARIATWTGDEVLTVPTSALFQRDGVWTVFAVEDGAAEERAVRIGHRTTTTAEVLGGLVGGDEVILYPPDEVADGVAVHARGGG